MPPHRVLRIWESSEQERRKQPGQSQEIESTAGRLEVVFQPSLHTGCCKAADVTESVDRRNPCRRAHPTEVLRGEGPKDRLCGDDAGGREAQCGDGKCGGKVG